MYATRTKSSKKILAAILSLLLAAGGLHADASVLPYTSYLYDNQGKEMAAPAAYAPEKMLELGVLDGVQVKEPAHMQIYGGDIFVADTGNSRILRLDQKGALKSVISSFVINGKQESFSEPQGFFIAPGGEMYVADTGNGRIVKLNSQMQGERVFERPDVVALGENYVYRPIKLGVDSAGRIFVIAQGINRGLMELTPDGEMVGFLGAPRVSVDLFKYIWKMFLSKEQRDKMEAFVPTEYSNLFVDSEDFIYATTSALKTQEVEMAIKSKNFDSVKMIVRLNPMGADILKRSGAFPPLGDLTFVTQSNDTSGGAVVTGASAFTAVTVDENGNYSCLDIRRGRIFTYDAEGNLLHIFGGIGNQLGAFRSPVAIGRMNGKFVVLDKALNRITFFSETDYGNVLNRAVAHQSKGEYDAALEQWEAVARYNGNYSQAYINIGKVYMRKKDYTHALEYFKLANEKKFASKAYANYRNQLLANNIYRILLVVLAFALVIFAAGQWIKRKWKTRGRKESKHELLQSLRYSLFVIFHPFKGFWDLKHERKGSRRSATVLLALLVLTVITSKQYTGYFFSSYSSADFNVFSEIAMVLAPFFLWCLANWCLTTLMDGEGALSDIYIASAYALVPYILIHLALTLFSHYMCLEELAYYNFFSSLAVIWSGGLLFFGSMTIHQYSLKKNILATLLTILGIGVLIFIGMLFYNLIDQISGFFISLYREITFRIS